MTIPEIRKHFIRASAAVLLAALAGGCFTVSETEYPMTETTACVASNRTASVRGFAATVTEYVSVGGWSTVYTPGYYGRYHYHPGGYQTIHTTTTVPQIKPTDAFLEQAKDRIEQAGCGIMAQTPDYIVEGSFSGPYVADGAAAWRFVRRLFSIFTCDKAATTWHGRLKIYDNRTGHLVLSRTYEQTYEVSMFSPIPLIGITHYDRTDMSYAKGWCLTALTDRMSADATAFLAHPEVAAK